MVAFTRFIRMNRNILPGWRLCCILLLGGVMVPALRAQGDSVVEEEIPHQYEEVVPEFEDYVPYTPKPVPSVPLHQVEDQQWIDAVNGLDYSKDQPEAPKEVKPQKSMSMPDWNFSTAFIGQIVQFLAIFLAIAGIGYALYRTLHAPRNKRLQQAEDGTLITIDNVDAYIHETDLERFLREALAAGNYPLGIRLYYLQIIKVLSEKNAIQWSREKTNRDYLREMRQHRQGEPFREVTRTFERVWYGNEPLDAAGFERTEPVFKQLLAQL
jgi:hypothetical protein